MAMNNTTPPTNVSDHVPMSNVLVDEEFDGESLKDSATILKFISDLLMDDDFKNEISTLHDQYSSALQATEKSLYDALHDNSTTQSLVGDIHHPSLDASGVKSSRYREEADLAEHIKYRSNKQSAANRDTGEDEPQEFLDKLMLFPNAEHRRRKAKNTSQPKGRSSNGEGKKFVDLSSLLTQCAQALESFNSKTLMDLMCNIRKHSSPRGTALERVAHYFANALDARLASNGSPMRDSTFMYCHDILRAHRMYIRSCPSVTMSNTFAKSTIMKLADGVATVHIIDFGIMCGFQWPCVIQALSERPGGPPKLRITGIDTPLPGFRPMEQLLITGRHLARYAERFDVPFEYNPIGKDWDTVTLEDLKIEKGEPVAVYSMYRLHNMIDGEVDSPRDAVLNLILKINPDVFIHGVVNGAYNAPFFVPRFKEAFFHYYAMFDMFEATVARDEEDQLARIVFEENYLGKAAMNVVACEGTERVESPETIKQWRFRTRRMGFRQLPIDGDVMRRMKKVKSSYHRHFSVYEEDKWVLLEWKGRVLNAISCWQPACT